MDIKPVSVPFPSSFSVLFLHTTNQSVFLTSQMDGVPVLFPSYQRYLKILTYFEYLLMVLRHIKSMRL